MMDSSILRKRLSDVSWKTAGIIAGYLWLCYVGFVSVMEADKNWKCIILDFFC